MKGVRKTSLLYIIPLIAILAIPILCGNVYAASTVIVVAAQMSHGATYIPPGGTYHYHTIGYFAWAAQWRRLLLSAIGDGDIYMGGSEGTTSWYCGGQQWWSQPNQIMYNIEVIKIKDLTTPNRIHRPEHNI
jgi:hypothetical protein